MSIKASFSSALREVSLHGGVGIVLPNQGKAGFHYARASDAADPKIRRLLLQDYQLWKGIVSDSERPLLDQVIKNLGAIDAFGSKMGGRAGAASFLEAVHEANPGEFCVGAETNQKALQIHNRNLKKHLIEKAEANREIIQANEALVQALREDPSLKPYLVEGGLLTTHNLNNYERLKSRIQAVYPGMMAPIAQMTQVLDSITLEEARIINEMNRRDFHEAGLQFHSSEDLGAASLRPLLEELYREGKLIPGKPFPIKLVLFGNNDIRNSLDMVMTAKVIREILLELNPELSKVKIPLYFSSFGGHPTTAAFSAFVELMTPKEVYEKLDGMMDEYLEPIKKALLDSAGKLPSVQKDRAISLIGDTLTKEKLTQLFNECPDLFKVSNIKAVTKLPLQIGPHKFFNGVGESVTHSSLVRELGGLVDERGEPYVTVLIEAHSTNTGDNVQNLVSYFPPVAPDDAPHMIIFDSFEMKRQLGTALTQFDTRSGGQLRWKSMRTMRNFIPASYFREAYTTDQLLIDAAARGAELYRSIAFPVQGYTAPLPSPDANYPILSMFYAKETGKAPEEVMKMRLVDIKAGTPFAGLENQIVPGHDPRGHVREFSRRFHQERSARLLREKDSPEFREYLDQKGKEGALKFRISKLNKLLARKK